MLVLLLLPALGAETDIVYLRSGAALQGRLIAQTDDAVKLEVKSDNTRTVISIDRNRVLLVDTPEAFNQRLEAAEALLAADQGPAAEDAYRELIRLEPNRARVRYGLARAMVANMKYAEALKTLEHHLELEQENRDAGLVLYLAQQYLQQRDFRNARRTARDAAALPSATEDLKTAADELVRRIERVRSGAEQLQERAGAEQAERARLRAERAEWDSKLGNMREAVEAGQLIADWTAEAQPRMLASRHVEITAPSDSINAYQAGGRAMDLQARVSKCAVKIRVDETIWLSLYDHQKAVFVHGWFHMLRDRYPRCLPSIQVVIETEERGRKVEKRVALGTWDGRRESVTVDRLTKENRDPSRPVRPIIR